jgi:hypothetical protein
MHCGLSLLDEESVSKPLMVFDSRRVSREGKSFPNSNAKPIICHVGQCVGGTVASAIGKQHCKRIKRPPVFNGLRLCCAIERVGRRNAL